VLTSSNTKSACLVLTCKPTQINFENTLAIELIKQQHCAHLIFEDEGANIGANHIPDCLQVRTKQADLVLLEVSTEQRLQVSMDAYVIDFDNYTLGRNNLPTMP
jgi:tRNA 2-selenouridine synthase